MTSNAESALSPIVFYRLYDRSMDCDQVQLLSFPQLLLLQRLSLQFLRIYLIMLQCVSLWVLWQVLPKVLEVLGQTVEVFVASLGLLAALGSVGVSGKREAWLSWATLGLSRVSENQTLAFEVHLK